MIPKCAAFVSWSFWLHNAQVQPTVNSYSTIIDKLAKALGFPRSKQHDEYDEHVIIHHLDIFCQHGRGHVVLQPRQAGDIDAAENWLTRMAEAVGESRCR